MATDAMNPWCGQRRTGSNRVMRGGFWNDDARNVRAAARNDDHPGNRNSNLGFRLARAQGQAGWPARDQTLTATGGSGAGENQAGAGVGVAGVDAPAKRRRRPTFSVARRA